MKKIKLLLLFLLLSIICLANKSIESIQDVTFLVTETLKVNGEKKKSEYILKYIKPNFIRKDVLKPELNRGEVYIYDNKEKITYLPLFDQITHESLENKEDNILESINYILKEKELVSGKIELGNGTVLELKKIKKISNYLLPEEVIIYDNDIEIANLEIKNYKLNSNLKREELLLHD